MTFQINQPTRKVLDGSFISCGKRSPNIIITYEDIIIKGNKVACRYDLSGTHKGQFDDLRPTDKQFRVSGMTVFSFRDAKVIERWNLVDVKSLGEQLRTQS